MSGTRPRRGFGGYLYFVVACVVLPIAWVRSLRFAQENAPKGRSAGPTMGIAIVASVVLFGAGLYAMHGLVVQSEGNVLLDNPVGRFAVLGDAAHGTYKTLDTRLAAATGETEYQQHAETVKAADASIGKMRTRIQETRAAGDEERAAGFEKALATLESDRNNVSAKMQALEPNHQLYLKLKPTIDSGPGDMKVWPTSDFPADERIKAEIAAARAQGIDYKGPQEGRDRTMDQGVARAFAIKDESVADMYGTLVLFVYPGLLGLLFAPLVWAQGRILDRNFRESDTVGFKPYPHAAAAWTLLLGAFGWPSILFAAWALKDINNRAAEGQIAL